MYPFKYTMQLHWAHSQHCLTITSIYYQNLSIAPKGNPKPISSHSLFPLPQPLAICQHIWKTQQWPQAWKRSVFIQIPKKGNAKECSDYCTIALISHSSKVMLKILQARLQQYMNYELPNVQAGFRKGSRTRDHIANIHWIIKKAREFQKNIYFWFIDYTKVFVWATTNSGKFLKIWEYQTTWPASWETCMQVRKQQ